MIYFLLPVVYFRLLGVFVLLPVIAPMLIAQGVSANHAAIAVGLYGLSQCVLQIPLAMLSDRIGRFAVVLLGLVLFCVGSLLAYLSTDIVVVYLARLLQGAGAITATVAAWVADVTSVKLRARSMATIGATVLLALMSSLIIGPMLSNWSLQTVFGITVLFGICAMVSLGAGRFLACRSSNYNPQKAVNKWQPMSKFKRYRLAQIVVAGFFVHYAIGLVFSHAPVYWQAHTDLTMQWQIHAISILLAGLVFLGVSKFIRRKMKWHNLSLVLVMLCVVGLTGDFMRSFFLDVVVLGFFYLGVSLLEAQLPARASRLFAAGNRGFALGLYTSAQFLGIFAGSSLNFLGFWQTLPIATILLFVYLPIVGTIGILKR